MRDWASRRGRGFRDRLDAVLGELAAPDRVMFFDLEPIPVASSDLRARLVDGEDVDGDVPAAALAIIRAEHLYTRVAGGTLRHA